METPQLFFIHGGMTFENQKDYLDFLRCRDVSIEEKIKWHGNYLKEFLGHKLHIIKPRMPLKDNSKYEEWKIHFEKFFDQLTDGIILVGESLSAIFLAKYLSENEFPRKIKSLYLVASPFDNDLTGEDLVGGFELGEDLIFVELRQPRE